MWNPLGTGVTGEGTGKLYGGKTAAAVADATSSTCQREEPSCSNGLEPSMGSRTVSSRLGDPPSLNKDLAERGCEIGRAGQASNWPTGPSRRSIGGGTRNAELGVRDGSAGMVWETGKSARDDLSRGGGGAADEAKTELVLLTTTVGESGSGNGACMAEGGEGGARATVAESGMRACGGGGRGGKAGRDSQ